MKNSELTRILDSHELWLASNGKEGSRANFECVSLARKNISGRCLREANFIGASLKGVKAVNCDFSFAWMTGADFTGADLHDSDFSNATMRLVSLRDAVTSGALGIPAR